VAAWLPARYLPDTYPLYGLQARGLDGADPPASSIREMAADYVEQIRAVQESGPYHLIGWSFGGIVAHEMAVQLRAAGEEIAALVILDAYQPTEELDIESKVESVGADDPALVQLAERVGQERGVVISALSEEELPLLERVAFNHDDILDTHEPRRFDGDLLLIVATQLAPDDPVGKWEPYVSGTILDSRLDCLHNDLVQPGMLAQVWDSVARWIDPGSIPHSE